MSNDKPESAKSGDSQSEPSPLSPAGAAPETSGHQQENWLDRIKAAIGLKAASSFREELEVALSEAEPDDGFTAEERTMLRNILRLRDVRVADIMIPRAEINAVESTATVGDLLDRFRECGHSRMPVYRESLDDPLGMIHVKDLMGVETRILAEATKNGGKRSRDQAVLDLKTPIANLDIIRNVLFVPPSMPVTALLARMQAGRMQMALVIDEYGGTDGLVSIEDVLETVVGDIEDEYDEDEKMISAEGHGVFVADARATIDDVREAIGETLAMQTEEAGEVDTVGGLVYSLAGRIPEAGETITAPGGYNIEIIEADNVGVKRVKISRPPADPASLESRPASGTA
ncbi:MAG: HlyC/CorC family transporter [Bauldia sp.]|nr:HlyC/CorC family transporter [Bauldia sp.]